MDRGKQVANSATERWRMKENRDRVVKRVADDLIQHVSPNLKFSLPELVQKVAKFEEKVYASAKNEDQYLRVVAAMSKSICAPSWKDVEVKVKNRLTSPSALGTDPNIDWQENVYEMLQFLKTKYDFLLHAFYKYVCKGFQTDTQLLNNSRVHKSKVENIFSLFELSKSQITVDMKDWPREIHLYIQGIIEVFKSPDVQSKQQVFAVPIGSSPRGINQPLISKGPDDPVQQQTNNAFEALREAVDEIEALRAAVDEIEALRAAVDELGLPTFVIPEGWKMPRNFVATALDTPSIFGSLFDGFNQRPKTAENQNLLAEIKDINNRLFDCEVVIAEKENVETAVGLAAKQSEGLLVKIMYNAVTINQNLVSKFTSDKKSLIKPLRLLIPASYPSSSLVVLDELPLKVSDNLRGLFERAKAKLKYKLQSMNVPWLIKDIARAWEHCAREAILEYADANGGGTFTSMHGDWDVC